LTSIKKSIARSWLQNTLQQQNSSGYLQSNNNNNNKLRAQACNCSTNRLSLDLHALSSSTRDNFQFHDKEKGQNKHNLNIRPTYIERTTRFPFIHP
jgi:hypothetical protein